MAHPRAATEAWPVMRNQTESVTPKLPDLLAGALVALAALVLSFIATAMASQPSSHGKRAMSVHEAFPPVMPIAAAASPGPVGPE